MTATAEVTRSVFLQFLASAPLDLALTAAVRSPSKIEVSIAGRRVVLLQLFVVEDLNRTMMAAAALLVAVALASVVEAFVFPPHQHDICDKKCFEREHACESSSSSWRRRGSSSRVRMSTPTGTVTDATEVLALTLEKPLGLILEESEDGIGGVIVQEVNEGGSAYECPAKDRLVQSKIGSVMKEDVTTLGFDDVMSRIIDAPSPFEIEFIVKASEGEVSEGSEGEEAPTYEVGSTVSILVQQPAETKKPDITLEAKVGDNLRKTLLDHGEIELYRGLKKKLGNCGGGGQCGFCAVDLVDDEGVWGERSDYEAKMIGRKGDPSSRLSCMNNIVGPCTVRTL